MGEIRPRGRLGRAVAARYQARGQPLSQAGWPVIVEMDAPFFRVPIYTLGASLVKRAWLLASPYDETLESHGLGDNYGVAIGFPGEGSMSCRCPGQAPPRPREPAGGRGAAERRMFALDYFIRTRQPLAALGVRPAWFLWSLVGGAYCMARAGSVRWRPRLGKTLWQVVRGRNPYMDGRGAAAFEAAESARPVMTSARLALIPFAVALAIAGVTRAVFAFDGLSSQDAYAYFNFARAIGPHLLHGAPLPDLFWPRGYPVAVAALLPITGGGPAAGQLVSTLACAGAAAATFLLVRALGARRVGGNGTWTAAAVAAGLAVAFSGATIRYSQLVMADALAAGLVAAALLGAARFAVGGGGGWLIVCAVALAWGTTTRWLVGLLVLPLAVYLLPALRRRRSAWPWAAAAAIAALAILVAQLAVASAFVQHPWVQHWSLAHAFRREFQTPESHEIYRLPVAVFYFVRLGWPDYFFPTLAVLAVAGLISLLRARDFSALALIAGWPAVALLFTAGIPYENPRFLVPTLPAIAALAGIGFGAVWGVAGTTGRRIAVVVFALSLAAGVAAGAREQGRQVARKNADLDLIAWTLARVPADAELLMEGPTLAFEHYGHRPARALFELTSEDVERVVRSGRPLYLLADIATLDGPRKGRGPELHLARLRHDPGLIALGDHPPYTLFVARRGQ